MTRRLPPLLALAGLLFLIGGFAYSAFQRAVASPGPAPLPATLADLPLLHDEAGSAAAEDIARLHRQTFPLSGAAVGIYGGSTGQATLWVSRSPLSAMAAQMERAMEEAIAAGNSPFSPEKAWQLRGYRIRTLSGMGQKHYYFRSGNLVLWLAADQALAEAALTDVVAFYD